MLIWLKLITPASEMIKMKIVRMTYGTALLCAMLSSNPLLAQTPSPTPPAAAHPTRPAPPTRDPNTPGYVAAKELPDGTNPPPDTDGNFIIGPTHPKALEMATQEGVGKVYNFTMSSADSKIYPGIAREPHTFGRADPTNPAQ